MGRRMYNMPADEQKRLIIEELQRLSPGGNRGVSITRYDNQRREGTPSFSLAKRLFGGWSKANEAAGLTPLQRKDHKQSPPRKLDEGRIDATVRAMDKREVSRRYVKPLVVICNDEPRPFRYYDPVRHIWVDTLAYGGGFFGRSRL